MVVISLHLLIAYKRQKWLESRPSYDVNNHRAKYTQVKLVISNRNRLRGTLKMTDTAEVTNTVNTASSNVKATVAKNSNERHKKPII